MKALKMTTMKWQHQKVTAEKKDGAKVLLTVNYVIRNRVVRFDESYGYWVKGKENSFTFFA